MKISVDALMSADELGASPEKVLKKVDELGEVLILQDNKPAYCIKRYKEATTGEIKKDSKRIATPRTKKTRPKKKTSKKGLTQKEAVIQVLSAADNQEMHASEIADAIFEQGLYRKKDGSQASASQVRAMCTQYKDDFEILSKNRIKLKS